MVSYLAVFLGSTTVVLLLTPFVTRIAERLGLLDHPDARKVHQAATPRIGGLAIAMATVVPALVILALIHVTGRASAMADPRLFIVLGSGLFVLLMGMMDDVKRLSSKTKLVALIAAALAVYALGLRIDSIGVPGGERLELGWFAAPLTVVWILGITVGMNFIDGLDGLAAGIGAIACAVVAVFAIYTGQMDVGILALGLLGSTVGFLRFNGHPAKIFMGDSGSLFIGFTLGTMSVLAAMRAESIVGVTLPCAALAVPLMDGFCTLIRRGIIKRRSLFAAEHGHIHHQLLRRGFAHGRAVRVIYLVTACSAVVGMLQLMSQRLLTVALVSGTIFVVQLAWFMAVSGMRFRMISECFKHNCAIGKERKAASRSFDEVNLRFEHVGNIDEWWRQICFAAELLGFERVRLPLTNRDGSIRELSWRRELGNGSPEHAVMSISLPVPQRRHACLLRAQVDVSASSSLEAGGYGVAAFGRILEEHSLRSVQTNDGSEHPILTTFGLNRNGSPGSRMARAKESTCASVGRAPLTSSE